MKIYAFCTADKYEGGMFPISLHTTKKGAYKAMNKYLNDIFQKERNEHILFGKGIIRRDRMRMSVEHGIKYKLAPFRCYEIEGNHFFIKEMEVQS